MKLSRVAVLGVAAAAGLIAMVLALNLTAPPAPKPSPEPVKQVDNTTKVLVATKDLAMGQTLNAGDLAWRTWPKDSISSEFITGGSQGSKTAVEGAIARASFYAGEPISNAKLIRSNRGFMSAILPKGKRAVAVKIDADTSAGGFILPNDHVDVIMTRRINQGGNSGAPEYQTETILQNVRVLAIDQTVEKTGKKDGGASADSVVGRTATLELTPEQAKIITVAQQMSERLNLALRSVADSSPNAPGTGEDAVGLVGGNGGKGTITVVRDGITSQVTGIR